MKHYFTKGECILYFGSVGLILLSFVLFDRSNYLTLTASLIGVTSLIFNAKGNPFGQLLMIVFSLIYGYISLTYAYFGEMITYLGMTAPMALFSLISWLRHPYQGNRSQVTVSHLNRKKIWILILLTALTTLLFYFILKAFHTANLFFSTLSVTTSFLAVLLTFYRSPYFALAYGANDVVLIILWALACRDNTAYFSVVICFLMFLANDLYGFLNWKRMEQHQQQNLD